MPHFKIVVAYDGTDFVGWQRQAAGTSIQGLLEDALRALDERDVTVHGAGRTDAGVHALGQVASFTLDRAIDADAVLRAINVRLPPAVRVLRAAEVDPAFHARFAARAKSYRYRMWNGEVISPFERAYAWHVPGALDIDAMRAAARAVEGRHDFAAFQAVGGSTKTTVREVFASTLATTEDTGAPGNTYERDGGGESSGRLLLYEITGSGFLRHMVRAMAGSLVEVGRGRRDVEWLSRALASRDRTQAGPTAPACGLFLLRVDYESDALADGP